LTFWTLGKWSCDGDPLGNGVRFIFHKGKGSRRLRVARSVDGLGVESTVFPA
jgi:hypothetical protein